MTTPPPREDPTVSDPIDVPCCAGCGRELGNDYAEIDITERDPWAQPDPVSDTTVVLLVCHGCREIAE